MPYYEVKDWTAAYSIEPHIAGAYGFYEGWERDSLSFREAMPEAQKVLDLRYGPAPRNLLDIFLPGSEPRGLVVFVHGGYWSECNKHLWSHFARGVIERGFAMCVPGYTLCPHVRIGEIVSEVASAVERSAREIAGPIALTGHSAGGHLASRLVSAPKVLSDATLSRIVNLVSISGLHDLRPIMETAMNETLAIDEAEAMAHSPALLRPARDLRVTCWVGSAERAELIRQSELLANVWAGLGCSTATVVAPDRHHFDVIDDLRSANSDLINALVGPLEEMAR